VSLGPVKRLSTRLSALRGALLLSFSFAAIAGCGSSGAPTGDPASTQASCNAYCTAYLAAACPDPIYTSLDDCKMAECFHLPQAPAICQTTIKAYYDCVQGQQDICADCAQMQPGTCPDTSCNDEFMAMLTCQ